MRRKLHIVLFLSACFPLAAQEIHEVTPLMVGTTAEDYAPVLMDGGFVMCSLRESTSTITFRDDDTGKPLSDLYWVPLVGEVPGTPVLFSAELTTPVNEGPAAFTNNGKTICYTRNQVLPKRLRNLRISNSQLGLYTSNLENGIWTSPVAFEHNSNKYSTMHPAFGERGASLVFASDMPGGHGGVDLYRCTKTADGWSVPENLGPGINGPSNETFPSFGPNGKLYFSSDRQGGLGKLDIYVAIEADDTWASPQPLPAPVNSPGNDMGMAVHKDGRTGYFSSDRGGLDRIFSFKRTVPKFRDCTEQIANNFCYSFKSKPHAATSTIPVDHVWELGDGTKVTGQTAKHCYEKPGTYNVRSLLVDRKTGSVFHVLKSHQVEVTIKRQAWITAPDTVRTGRALALDGKGTHLPDLFASEYHWDMGDGNVLSGMRTQHTYRAPGTYLVKLDVLSVPDSKGIISNACNTRQVIVMDRFRDQEDMTVVATYQDALGKNHTFTYQELPFDQMGMRSDDMEDAVFSVELFASIQRVDLDDPRFLEVRKLYRVIERFDPERGLYTYSVGETKDIEALYKIYMKVKELQFMDAEVYLLKEEKLMDLSQLDLSSLEELNHSKFRTNAILFDYNSSVLDPSSDPVLQQVVSALRQHPELKLVIEAHTDDVGGRSFNMDLSQQRARSVQTFLEVHGVEPARLVPVGHGKNQPIASNKTEEGRQLNRRVEFRMTVKGEEQAFEKTR